MHQEGDEHKAAFTMNCGLFKTLVMFFGPTNSLARSVHNTALVPMHDDAMAVEILLYSFIHLYGVQIHAGDATSPIYYISK